MARDWKTTYSASAASATHIATFPEAAEAGRRLVAIAAAPATIAAPAGWAKIADPIGDGELLAAYVTAAGGEDDVTWNREAGQSTAPRTLAGWVESRDDIGDIDGIPHSAAGVNSGGPGAITFELTTTVSDARVYVAIGRTTTPSDFVPTFDPPTIQLDDAFTAPGHGNENARLIVASGVIPLAGTHTITIGTLPQGALFEVLAFAVTPADGGEPPPAAETAVEAENRLGGVAKATWDVDPSTPGGHATIQGFSTAMSVARGGTLQLKVHSPNSAWTGKVYRLGYYGGLGARELGSVSGAQTTQPNGTTDPDTGMVSCANWAANGSWNVPADAPAGVYVIKIQRADNAAMNSHIGPFVVTNPGRKAAVAVKLSDSTWQAYNHAGADPSIPFNGYNLYGAGSAAGFGFNQAARCFAVSYDRPLVTRLHISQTNFFNAEYPLIRWLERLGYDVDYLSCAMVDADADLLLGRAAIVSSGHDEYWSAGMMDAFEQARDDGTDPSHAVWLSGNEAFWRIRFASGRRSFECRKDTHDGEINETGLFSGTWQDTRSFNTDRRPPALLNGQRFKLNGIAARAMACTAPHADSPFWRDTAVAALTGTDEWASPVGIVGFEADEPADVNPAEAPEGLIRLSQVTATITGGLSDVNGDNYSQSGQYVHSITAYRAASGATVFGFGTVQYAWALDETHDRHPGGTLVSPTLQQALTNMFADLGAVPPAYPFPGALVLPEPVDLTEYGFPAVEDETPPSAPGSLQATPGQTQLALTWAASSDNIGVSGYDLYRGATLVQANVQALTYTFTGLTAGTTYTLGVRAKDAAGNQSTLATVTVATMAAPGDEPIPGAYATIAQLDNHLGETPTNARTLLIRASRAVDRAILTAVYDRTSETVLAALRDATLEQIAGQLEGGDKNGLGVSSKVGSFTIGKLNVQRSASSSTPPTTAGLVDQAYAILQAAGLTGHAPWVAG